MAIFKFEAMDANGHEIKDEIEADSQDEAQARIKSMGYFVTKIKRSDPAEVAIEAQLPSEQVVEPVPQRKLGWTQAHDDLLAKYPLMSMWHNLRHPTKVTIWGWFMFVLPIVTAIGLYCVEFVEETPPGADNFVHLALIVIWISLLVSVPAWVVVVLASVLMKVESKTDEDHKRQHEYFMIVYQSKARPLVHLTSRLGQIALLFILVLTGRIWTTVFFTIMILTNAFCYAGNRNIMMAYIRSLSPEEIAKVEALVAKPTEE